MQFLNLCPEQQKLVDSLSKSYWLTPNEKREAIGYGSDEDNPVMDDYLVPSGFVPISDLDMNISEDINFPNQDIINDDIIEEEEIIEEEIIEEEIIEDIIEDEEKKITIKRRITRKCIYYRRRSNE